MSIHSKKRRFKNLDASRFIAFFLVFIAHGLFTSSEVLLNNETFGSIYSFLKFGVLGVDYFFVQSSFLITWVILEEKKFNGNEFNFKKFIVRRSLRIWPLYFLIVFFGYSLWLFLDMWNIPIQPLPPIQYFLLFVSNFYIINHGNEFLFFMVVLWSISVEEQFYLLWAGVNKLNTKWFFPICFLLIIFSLVYRAYTSDTNSMAFELSTFSLVGNFGVGALAAYGLFNNSSITNYLSSKTNKLYSYLLILTTICSVVLFPIWSDIFILNVFSKLILSSLFALLIIDWTSSNNTPVNFSKNALISRLGRVSYGLYCYHAIVITIISIVVSRFEISNSGYMVYLVQPIIVLIITAIISRLSYQYFESYFLKLKKDFY
ncbi:MAG: acyltransferase family protein [Salibacteraceae bacterium]